MKKINYIFEDYQDFIKNRNGNQNGCTEDFLHYWYDWYNTGMSTEECLNDFLKDDKKEGNKKCFNCRGCYDCEGCVECVECEDCKNCLECEEHCYKCECCVNCEDCDNCENCIECNNCKECEMCEECVECVNCSKCFNCKKCDSIAEFKNIDNLDKYSYDECAIALEAESGEEYPLYYDEKDRLISDYDIEITWNNDPEPHYYMDGEISYGYILDLINDYTVSDRYN